MNKEELLKKLNLKKHIRDVQNFELNNDTLNNTSDWPLFVKIIVSMLMSITILAISYQFYFKAQQRSYETLIKAEKGLKEQVVFKINLTAGEKQYQDKINIMNKSFKSLLLKLPSDIEMDELLEDITNKGNENGIEFKKLQMLKPLKSEFYVEHPIEIIIDGSYHSLSGFIGDISNLSRIVTFHDFDLTPSKNKNGLLELKILAKTYKYKDSKEDEEDTKNENN